MFYLLEINQFLEVHPLVDKVQVVGACNLHFESILVINTCFHFTINSNESKYALQHYYKLQQFISSSVLPKLCNIMLYL